jgi:hypothetical protein
MRRQVRLRMSEEAKRHLAPDRVRGDAALSDGSSALPAVIPSAAKDLVARGPCSFDEILRCAQDDKLFFSQAAADEPGPFFL